MKPYKNKHTTLYKFDLLEHYHEVRHFVTTRDGGFSPEPFNGFNLGFGTDDNPEFVGKNRQALAEATGIPLDWFVFPRQTHSCNIVNIEEAHKGKGVFTRDDAISDTDALITNKKNICLMIQVADCVPVLLLDSANSVIAAIHAGWRGTVKEIVSKTIGKMNSLYSTNPEDIIACIGPSIGQCCYEVGDEVKNSFLNISDAYAEAFIENGKKPYLDLWKANKLQLLKAGVSENNIEVAGLCTKCNHEKFFSSRHGKGNTGRFAAGIMLQ